MLILTMSLWTISIILLLADSKAKTNRWLSAAAFVSGLGGFSALWEDTLIPWIVGTFYLYDQSVLSLDVATTVFSAISHYFLPYTILVYGIIYSELFEKHEKPIALLLLAPIVYTLIQYPYHSHFMSNPKELTQYYRFLSFWALPYMFFTNLLIIYPYITEKKKIFKKSKLLNCLILVPFITFSMFTNYLFRYLGIHDTWRYNGVVIAIQFIGFIYFALRYGILGVRLKLEQDDLGNVLKIINSGTAMLNHTLKNEMLKISLCCNFIRNSQEKPNPNVDDKLKMIEDSIKHLLTMGERAQKHSKEIELLEEPVKLSDLIKSSLSMVAPLVLERNIKISIAINLDITLLCDELHLKEVLINLFKNGIEAMDRGGNLSIDVDVIHKKVYVAVKDSGSGIPSENLPYILEPFFTTKSETTNFGLGLAYCHSVMKCHGGSLDIQSTQNIGTCITLIFPRRALISSTQSSTKPSLQ